MIRSSLRQIRALGILVLASWLFGNFALAENKSLTNPEWQSGLYSDHSLVGKIWHAGSATFIPPEKLVTAMDKASYLLLGEKHDNPDHHHLQQDVMAALMNTGRLGFVTFEMLNSDATDLLNNISGQQFSTMDEIRDYLNWNTKGWNWDFYGPMIKQLLDANIPLGAANMTRAEIGGVYGQPLDEMVATVLGDEANALLDTEIDQSHCGLLPASQFPAMVSVQKSRDNHMAKSLVGAGTNAEGIRVLIAGDYHIRHDLGIPNYILAHDKNTSRSDIVSVAFIEVRPSLQTPEDYIEGYLTHLPYDYIWFTPAISDEDYCDSLRKKSS